MKGEMTKGLLAPPSSRLYHPFGQKTAEKEAKLRTPWWQIGSIVL